MLGEMLRRLEQSGMGMGVDDRVIEFFRSMHSYPDMESSSDELTEDDQLKKFTAVRGPESLQIMIEKGEKKVAQDALKFYAQSHADLLVLAQGLKEKLGVTVLQLEELRDNVIELKAEQELAVECKKRMRTHHRDVRIAFASQTNSLQMLLERSGAVTKDDLRQIIDEYGSASDK